MKRALSPQRRISLPRKTADRKATAASPDDDGADAAAAGAIVAIAKASRGPQGRITGLRLPEPTPFAPENAFEPELTQAVADLDTKPAETAPMHREPPPPAPAPQALEASPPAAEAPPRRRSTVREPAPIGGSETPAPMPPPSPEPSPVVVESGEAEAKNQPRKTGWWSRRIMGG